MTMYAGLVLGGLFFAIVFCTVITIEDIKEIYNEADLFFTDDADRPNVQYLNIFYEDRMFRDFEIILTINLN